MGKEVKDSKIEEIVDIDLKKEVNNIEEALDKDTALNKEAVKAAAAKIEKARKEITEAEAEKAIYQSEYLSEMQRLHLQRKRREIKADKAYLDFIGKDGLTKDLFEGKLLPREFEAKVDEAKKVKAEAYKAAAKRFDEYHETLKTKYKGYWVHGWFDPVWR